MAKVANSRFDLSGLANLILLLAIHMVLLAYFAEKVTLPGYRLSMQSFVQRFLHAPSDLRPIIFDTPEVLNAPSVVNPSGRFTMSLKVLLGSIIDYPTLLAIHVSFSLYIILHFGRSFLGPSSRVFYSIFLILGNPLLVFGSFPQPAVTVGLLFCALGFSALFGAPPRTCIYRFAGYTLLSAAMLIEPAYAFLALVLIVLDIRRCNIAQFGMVWSAVSFLAGLVVLLITGCLIYTYMTITAESRIFCSGVSRAITAKAGHITWFKLYERVNFMIMGRLPWLDLDYILSAAVPLIVLPVVRMVSRLSSAICAKDSDARLFALASYVALITLIIVDLLSPFSVPPAALSFFLALFSATVDDPYMNLFSLLPLYTDSLVVNVAEYFHAAGMDVPNLFSLVRIFLGAVFVYAGGSSFLRRPGTPRHVFASRIHLLVMGIICSCFGAAMFVLECLLVGRAPSNAVGLSIAKLAVGTVADACRVAFSIMMCVTASQTIDEHLSQYKGQ